MRTYLTVAGMALGLVALWAALVPLLAVSARPPAAARRGGAGVAGSGGISAVPVFRPVLKGGQCYLRRCIPSILMMQSRDQPSTSLSSSNVAIGASDSKIVGDVRGIGLMRTSAIHLAHAIIVLVR
jgi:hypothetical protein